MKLTEDVWVLAAAGAYVDRFWAGKAVATHKQLAARQAKLRLATAEGYREWLDGAKPPPLDPSKRKKPPKTPQQRLEAER
eukprot:SAG11_NODE_3903_length_2156_cov_2.599417_2_plen_79_part_01